MKFGHIKFGFVIIFTLILSGCGSDKVKETNNLTETIDMGNVKYAIPLEIKSKKLNGSDAVELLSKKENVLGLAYVDSNTSSSKIMKTVNMERTHSAKITTAGIESIYNGLQSDDNTKSVSLQSAQSFKKPYAFTISDYRVITDNPISLSTVQKQIMGYLDGNTTGFTTTAAESNVTDYRVLILYGLYQKSDLYLVSIVSQSDYSEQQTLASAMINASSYIPNNGTFQKQTQTFKTGVGKNKMDFLFVVDDSGSMSDDQDALSEAADDFTREMKNSGVNYRSAIITTSYGISDNEDGDANRILQDVGIIENNETLLKNNLVLGTRGSNTETGIYNAEQALQSIAKGDEEDGSVTALGMPQKDADLSVIIISDEPSQYRYRSNRNDFNVSNNLFTKRDITVYGIIENLSGYRNTSGNLDEYNLSQYDDLVDATGGIYADIKSTDSNGSLDFSNIMHKIARDAGGVASQFSLKNWATIITEVKVSEKSVLNNAINGYTYNQANKSIVFHGTALPEANSTVEIEYKFYQYED